jgi:hypothetical protein
MHEADEVSLNARISALDSEQDADQVSIDAAISSEASARISGDASVLAAITSGFKKIEVLSVNTTLTNANTHIVAGADGLTFTLPAAPSADEVYFIKNFDGVDAQVTIAGGGSPIDGQSSIVLDVPNAAVKCVYDSATDEWYIF